MTDIKFTIDKINLQVAIKNIKCISTVYVNNKHKLSWQCLICYNIFSQSKSYIDKDFTKCTNCVNNNKFQKLLDKLSILEGKTFNTKYLGSHIKMDFVCKNNHLFKMTYNNIVNLGHWCPKCSTNNNISENICRVYMEVLFGQFFPKIRPKWLIGNHNRNLELDGYCGNLNLAFEHQGSHHYKNTYSTNRLEKTIINDDIKRRICKDINVKLVIIPQLFNKTPLNKLRQFIINESQRLGIEVPNKNAQVYLSDCYKNSKVDVFERYTKIATTRGGKCISDEYLGANNEKLIWECQFGHQWKQFPYVIKKGHWCPICAGQKQSKNIIFKKIKFIGQ